MTKEERRIKSDKAAAKERRSEALSRIDFDSKYKMWMVKSGYCRGWDANYEYVEADIKLDRDGHSIIATRPGYTTLVFQTPEYFNFLVEREKKIEKAN